MSPYRKPAPKDDVNFAHIRIDFDEKAITHEARLVRLRAVLEALVVVDTLYLKANPETKPLYEHELSTPHMFDGDNLHDIACVRSMGAGSPMDLVCWRVAELRLAGHEEVYPFIKETVQDGTSYYSARVLIGDVIEDPAAIFGMK